MQRSTIHYATILCSVLFAAQAPAQSLNPSVVWGVIGASIFHYNASGWTLIAPPPNVTPSQVSAGADGTVWEVNTDNTLYSYTGTNWQIEPGLLTQVSVGSANNVWGAIGTSIFQWNGSAWSLIPTGFASIPKQVSVAMDGTVWALDQSGDIYVYGNGAWTLMGGILTQVSVGSVNNVWGVNPNNVIFQWNGSAWNAMPPPPNATPQQVSVGADGTVYAIDTATYIYQWNGTAWQPFPGLVAQISGGLSDRFFYNNPAVTSQGAWSAQSNPSAAASSYLQDSTAGDTLTFKFTGDSVALYRLVDPNGGQATLTMDGNSAGTFDFYFPQQRWQIPAVLDHLGAGPHTLVLTVSAQNNPASAGHNIYIDTFAAPSPFVPNADQQTALSRVNFYRNQAGLPPAALNNALDLAAQAHASYAGANGLSHVEAPNVYGFVGAQVGDRAAYFGYPPQTNFSLGSSETEILPVQEDAAGGGLTTSVSAGVAVDAWMGEVYHRQSIMNYSYVDIGYGDVGNNSTAIMDFGGLRGSVPAGQTAAVFTYPSNGATGIPTSYCASCESPDPLPAGVTTAGFPVSVHIAQPASLQNGTSTAPNTYQLSDSAGNPVPTYNVANGGDNVFMIPQQPLNAAMTYYAHMAGTDSQGNMFNKSWSFTTLPADTISNANTSVAGSSVVIFWNTSGPVNSTALLYGTTTAYGTTLTDLNPGSTSHQVTITGIPGGVYHYQITAVDSSGVPYTTPDMTFVFPTIQTTLVTFQFAAPSVVFLNAELIEWQTAGPVDSTKVQYGPTTAYGAAPMQGTLIAGSSPPTYAATLFGLTPSTTYHFVISATAAGQATYTTSDQTFVSAAQQ